MHPLPPNVTADSVLAAGALPLTWPGGLGWGVAIAADEARHAINYVPTFLVCMYARRMTGSRGAARADSNSSWDAREVMRGARGAVPPAKDTFVVRAKSGCPYCVDAVALLKAGGHPVVRLETGASALVKLLEGRPVRPTWPQIFFVESSGATHHVGGLDGLRRLLGPVTEREGARAKRRCVRTPRR